MTCTGPTSAIARRALCVRRFGIVRTCARQPTCSRGGLERNMIRLSGTQRVTAGVGSRRGPRPSCCGWPVLLPAADRGHAWFLPVLPRASSLVHGDEGARPSSFEQAPGRCIARAPRPLPRLLDGRVLRRSRLRQIDDAGSDKGPAVIDADDDFAAVSEIGDLGIARQTAASAWAAVSSSMSNHSPFDVLPAMELRSVPGGHARPCRSPAVPWAENQRPAT